MAHFAQINDGIVTQIIVVNNEDCGGGDYPESEPIGQAYIVDCGLNGHWIQCSYNNNFRRKYPRVGDVYDSEADIFHAPQPFPSWTMDMNYAWQPPIPYPQNGHDHWWDEDEMRWIQFESPIVVSDD